jgi:hypothetical protein
MAKGDAIVDHYSHGRLLDAILAGVTALVRGVVGTRPFLAEIGSVSRLSPLYARRRQEPGEAVHRGGS